MKNLIGLLIIITLFACSQNQETTDVISIDFKDYLTKEDVDTPAKLKSEQSKKDLETTLKESSSEEKTRQMSEPSEYQLLVNKKGTVDKIIVYHGIDKSNSEYVINNLKSWLFDPAVKNGEPVKFKYTWTFDNSPYYVSVDSIPSPVGGIKALVKNIKYPEEAKRAGIQGKVFVRAYIDEDGNVVKTEILKSVNELLDKASQEAIMKTKFTPGIKDGRKVKVQISIPVLFKLH